MTALSLREAAEQAGTSKSTIFRAIKAGRLSAARTEDGGFAIDPAELFRVYKPKEQGVAAEHLPQRSAGQDATTDGTGTIAAETALKLAVMETELKALKDMVSELRQARDAWQGQAERLAIAAPSHATGPEPRRSWWRRLVG